MGRCIWKRHFALSLAIAVLFTGVLALSAQQSANCHSPHLCYDSAGRLLLPKEFERWIFVGSNIGLQYKDHHRPGPPRFHNLYINPEAYDWYKKDTGREFPDLTVLVMDRYEQVNREPQDIVDAGSFNGKRVGIEVAVKNKAIPGKQEAIPAKQEASKDVWAYYEFSDATAPAERNPDSQCSACHAKHASVDQVWEQFYPVLRHARGKE